MPITYTGELVERETAVNLPLLPKIEKRTRPKFILMVHRDHYDWIADEKEYLPRFSQLKIDPGVGGVGLAADNKTIILAPALANAAAKKFIVLHNGDPKLADVLPNGSYLQRFPARGGVAYALAWETAHDVAGTIEWETEYELLRTVQRHVKEVVLGGEPDPRWKRKEIRLQGRSVQRLADKFAQNPGHAGVKNRLQLAQERLEDLKADLAKHSKAAVKAKKAAKGAE